MEEMVAEFLPFFLFVSYFCHKTKEDGKDDLQDSIVKQIRLRKGLSENPNSSEHYLE